MTLKEQIHKDFIEAYKAKDTAKIACLKMVKAAFTDIEKSKDSLKEGGLVESDYMKALNKLLKQRLDSAEIYNNAGRHELFIEETHEAAMISHYIPQQMTEDDVLPLILATLTVEQLELEKKNMGAIVKAVVAASGGKTDGKTVSGIVGKLIAGGGQ